MTASLHEIPLPFLVTLAVGILLALGGYYLRGRGTDGDSVRSILLRAKYSSPVDQHLVSLLALQNWPAHPESSFSEMTKKLILADINRKWCQMHGLRYIPEDLAALNAAYAKQTAAAKTIQRALGNYNDRVVERHEKECQEEDSAKIIQGAICKWYRRTRETDSQELVKESVESVDTNERAEATVPLRRMMPIQKPDGRTVIQIDGGLFAPPHRVARMTKRIAESIELERGGASQLAMAPSTNSSSKGKGKPTASSARSTTGPSLLTSMQRKWDRDGLLQGQVERSTTIAPTPALEVVIEEEEDPTFDASGSDWVQDEADAEIVQYKEAEKKAEDTDANYPLAAEEPQDAAGEPSAQDEESSKTLSKSRKARVLRELDSSTLNGSYWAAGGSSRSRRRSSRRRLAN